MAAFLGVFVSGSVLVSLMRHADEADAAASPSASVTPTSPQPEPGPVVDAYLAWVPDGLPPAYGATIARLPTVGKLAVVASALRAVSFLEMYSEVPTDRLAYVLDDMSAYGIDVREAEAQLGW